jgi:Ca2+-binding RTX toxin-like protein
MVRLKAVPPADGYALMPATPTFWRNLGQLNTTDGFNGFDLQRGGRAVQLADGNLLFIWESNTNTGAGIPAGFDVIGQVFDPTGKPVGNEFRLNNGWFSDDEADPSIAVLPSGAFAAVYADNDGSTGSIRLDVFGYDGNHVNSIQIETDATANAAPIFSRPQIVFGTGPLGLIIYQKDNGGGDVDVVLRNWSPDSGNVSPEITIFNGAAATGGGIDSFSIASLTNGNFVVAISDRDSFTESDVTVALLAFSGGPITYINIATGPGRQDNVSVTGLTGGGFVTAWTSGGDIFFSRHTFNLTPVQVAVPVTGAATGIQTLPSVTQLEDGGFVIAWVDLETNSVFMRSYTENGVPEGERVTVVSLPDNGSDGYVTGVEAKTMTDGRITVTYTVATNSDADVFAKIYDPRDSVAAGQFGNDVIVGRVGNDLLIGAYGNDALYGWEGDDTLSGGESGIADTLVGGLGNDIYIDALGDAIVELSGEGNDTAQSASTFSLVLLQHVENVILTGSADVNASGNTAANRLIGNSGNNILNGQGGVDTMAGGLGNDTYYVDHAGDVTTEAPGGGTDLVSSSVSRTLSANIENLNLSGATNIDGNGNTAANKINGNAGNNILRGYEGADTLNGGAGNDILLGGTASDSINPGSDAVRDIIRFSAVADSTGSQRDIITGLDLTNEDRLDFTVVPTALAFVGGGALNLATINADLAAAVDGALAVNGAVLFDPTSGDMNVSGHLFVVVDANGDGIYKPNQDYVVQLVNSTGFLTLDDFI